MKIKNSIFTGLFAGFLLMVATAGAETPLYFGWPAVTPRAAEFTGDGHNEIAVYDSDTGQSSVRSLNGDVLASDVQIGLSGFKPTFGDYDGDRITDPGSYNPANGDWFLFLSSLSYQLDVFQGMAGNTNTVVVSADYDGNTMMDLGLYDPISGVWLIQLSTAGYETYSFILGGNGADAVPADYDGDGKVDPAIYDQTTGLWMVLCSASQYAATWVVYGGPGCEAAPADFDGDRRADPTVYNAALGVWGTLNSASNYVPNIIIQGGPDCIPIPGHYYLTNRTDYAVFNTTNYGWYIAYESPMVGGIWSDMACGVLPSLLTADWKSAVKGGIGWGLSLIFNRNEEDPHWTEMRDILSEMNGKLDALLNISSTILNNLNELCRQMQYDTAKTQLLISQLLVNQAFVTIKTRYDSSGPQGYRTFYGCDTNHPPSAQDVADFVNVVLYATSPDLPTCINQIRSAILPTLETEEGVLRQWAKMAKMLGITPQNLLDHGRSFLAYFSTLYSYQVKAAELYVDASRQAYTSEFQKAQPTLGLPTIW